MEKVLKFVKDEAVLVISGVLAFVSCFATHPDKLYFNYINFDVLILLFCLMVAVAGFREIGVFDYLCRVMLKRVSKLRAVSMLLCLFSFVTGMFLTNDVTLVTVVPFTLLVFGYYSSKSLIFLLIMETVSANLGSMLTPLGNPQNLYIYDVYNFEMSEFLLTMLPYSALALLLIFISCVVMFNKKDEIVVPEYKKKIIDKRKLLIFSMLFILSILAVLHILNYFVLLAIVIILCIFTDYRVIFRADYYLLLTFVFFFIFIGNIGRVDVISEGLKGVVTGNEILVSVFLSQFISNVPAAVLLSDFTKNGKELLIGINLGGLGTIIASMASLITYKFYVKIDGASAKKYILYFSFVSVIYLVALIGLSVII